VEETLRRRLRATLGSIAITAGGIGLCLFVIPTEIANSAAPADVTVTETTTETATVSATETVSQTATVSETATATISETATATTTARSTTTAHSTTTARSTLTKVLPGALITLPGQVVTQAGHVVTLPPRVITGPPRTITEVAPAAGTDTASALNTSHAASSTGWADNLWIYVVAMLVIIAVTGVGLYKTVGPSSRGTRQH
jgi:type VI secretion system secreted protein VgrG